MAISTALSHTPSYSRNGKQALFDPVRSILVLATPEEKVRQELLVKLIDKWKIPAEKIMVEYPISREVTGIKLRADLIIKHPITDKCWILFEAKSPDTTLTDAVRDQAIEYKNHLLTEYICLTNGAHERWFHVSKENNEVQEIHAPSSLKVLLKGKIKYKPREPFYRIKYEESYDNRRLKMLIDDGIIGSETPLMKVPFVVNFDNLLINEVRYIHNHVHTDTFKILSDGLRIASFGNAGGGNYGGDYRFFMIEFPDGSHNIISLAVFGVGKKVNDPHWGNRNSYTSLLVAIDDFEKRHNSLQLNIDRYLHNDSNWSLRHDGTITVGKTGAAKRSVAMNFYKTVIPELIVNDEVHIGDLPKGVLFTWENSQHVIINLIKYALARDEYRRIHKLAKSQLF